MDNGASSYCRFLAGDESGLVEIIRDYKDGLILYLNGYVMNIHIAEELAEDTFVKIGLKRPKDMRRGSFKTWLYTIGRNTAIDYLRKKKQHPTVSLECCPELASDEDELERNYIRQEQEISLYHALGRIKTEYRQILWLTYFEGFSNKEAASIMKKTVHSIDTLVYRAKKSLKTELVKEGFVYEEF